MSMTYELKNLSFVRPSQWILKPSCKILSELYKSRQHDVATSQLQGPWLDAELFLLSLCSSCTCSPYVLRVVWFSPTMQKHASRWTGSDKSCEWLCVHGALWWTDVPSRMYSHLIPSVPRIGIITWIITTDLIRLTFGFLFPGKYGKLGLASSSKPLK